VLDRGESPGAEGPLTPPLRRMSGGATVRSFARFVSEPAERRPAVTRLTLAIVATLLLLALILAGGARGFRAAVGWLHSQPESVCRFRDIQLEPSPPPWIKSGRGGLLERVLTESGSPEHLPVLDLDLGEIEKAFKLHSPWVERVERVERAYPNRLTVRLRYREPVGEARWENHLPVLVDREAVILPLDDLDRKAAGPLILITPVEPPLDARPGRFWGIGESSGELARPEPKVAAAARLAAFFKERQNLPGAVPPEWRIVGIHVDFKPGLVAEAANKTLIFWGEPPGRERPGDATPEQKWVLLREWFGNPANPTVEHPDFLEFTRHRVKRHLEGRPSTWESEPSGESVRRRQLAQNSREDEPARCPVNCGSGSVRAGRHAGRIRFLVKRLPRPRENPLTTTPTTPTLSGLGRTGSWEIDWDPFG
jgi:hypothetical protein